MARSKPNFRPKKTGSCPCVQDANAKEKEIREVTDKLVQQEARFSANDMYNPSDEYIDLESYSYSEVSSFGVHGESIAFDQSVPADIGIGETPGAGIGDQVEEETYHSEENVSSGQPEDSEPNENSTSFEDRKLNIAATVMSWLDNYGQARGYSRQNGNDGGCGTSIMINPDNVSRIDSASIIDVDEAVSSKSQSQSQCQSRNGADYIVGPDSLKQQFTLLETSCSILINFHHDLEPLVSNLNSNSQTQCQDLDQQRSRSINWRKIQEVFSTWANLMSTIWKRSREGNITKGELYSFTKFCENLESLAAEVSPVDISKFINPVVRMSLSRTQGFISLAQKWANEIAMTGKFDSTQNGIGITCWNDLMKTVTMIVNEQLKFITISYAKNIIENQTKYGMYPKYEILLHDVMPSKTVTGWMFYGKVELRYVENDENITKQINVQVMESGLRLTFMASTPKMSPCIDYGSIFHIVNRACLECSQYYEEAGKEILMAKQYLNQPLISPYYAKKFGKYSKYRQYTIMSDIINQIIADHAMDPTITAIDEILRRFDTLIVTIVKVFKTFISRIKYNDNKVEKGQSNTNGTNYEQFSEIAIPMTTDTNTMLFHTVRRFLALGPKSASAVGNSSTVNSNINFNESTIITPSTSSNTNEKGKDSQIQIHDEDQNDSILKQVNACLENCLHRLYHPSSKNVFTFHVAVQTLFAISQLTVAPEFLKKASLDQPMKTMVLWRLKKLKSINRATRNSFKEVVALIDKQMKDAEVSIDKIMAKGTALGITVPARTSGVRFSHRHDQSILIRYNRNSYIRNQAKRLRQSYEVHRHTRKYVVEPDFEEECVRSSSTSTTTTKKSISFVT